MMVELAESVHVARLQARKNRTTRRMAEYARQNNITDLNELADVRLPWFEIRNADPDASPSTTHDRPVVEATVFIYEEIGGSFGIEASELSREIEALDVDRINVRINSPGGDVFDALAIHSSLLHHRAHVVTYVDGIAASAASVIAMAGDEVIMMPGSEMMIHDASCMIDGNPKAHEGAATFLHRQSDNIAGIYAARAGGDVAEWRAIMQAETWLFAREAVSARLATSVWAVSPYPEASHPKEVPYDPIEARMARSHDLREWRYRHDGRRAAPAPNIRGTREPVVVRQREEAPIPVVEMPANSERMAAAANRAANYDEERQRRGVPQLRLQDHAPSGVYRPGVEFTSRLVATSAKRDGKEFVHLDGYATVYDKPYEMWDTFGPYEEIVVSGAADTTLASNPDTAFLVNHRGLTMARTTNGSLILNTDKTGMPIEAWLNPVRSDVQLLRTAIEDGDITEMSFAFVITRGEWSDDFLRFYIRAFDIHRGDVSAVNYGANPYTSISARTREIMQELEQLPGPAAREALRRLTLRLAHDTAPMPRAVPAQRDALDKVEAVVEAARQTPSSDRSIEHARAMLLLLEAD